MSSSPFSYAEKYSLPEYNYKSHPKASYESKSLQKVSLHYCKKTLGWIFSLKPRSLNRTPFGIAFGYCFYVLKIFLVMFFILSKLGIFGSSNNTTKEKIETQDMGPEKAPPEQKNVIQKIFSTTASIPGNSFFGSNTPRNMSRVFAHVNEQMPKSYYDWESTTIQYG